MSERKRLSKGRLSVYVMALLLGAALVACSSGISQEDYDTALADQAEARVKIAVLESQLSSVMDDNAKLQGQTETITQERDARLNELTTTREAVGNLRSQLTASQAENSDLSNQLSTALAENNSLERDLSDRAAQLLSVQAKVEQLNAVYPPRRFRDADELRVWYRENNISDMEAHVFVDAAFALAREVQLTAALDGYIISADFYEDFDDNTFLVWNSAVTSNGDYYWFYPGSEDIVYSYDVNSF